MNDEFDPLGLELTAASITEEGKKIKNIGEQMTINLKIIKTIKDCQEKGKHGILSIQTPLSSVGTSKIGERHIRRMEDILIEALYEEVGEQYNQAKDIAKTYLGTTGHDDH